MLGKIATAGQNGQFRTPRHIIALMVELTPDILSSVRDFVIRSTSRILLGCFAVRRA